MFTKRIDMLSRRPLLSFLAISAAFLAGYVPTFVSPWVIGALVSELGLHGTHSGIIVSLEFVGIALAGWISSPFMGRASPRLLAVIGAVIAFFAHGGSMLSIDFTSIAAFRFVAGLGGGLALAAGSATVSQQSNPDRIYGLLLLMMAIGSAITQFAASHVASFFGYRGLFAILAIYLFVAVPLMALLPLSMERTPREVGDTSRATAVPAVGLSIIIAVICFTITQMGAWTFLERQGNSIGFNATSMSTVFGIGQVVGLAGGGAAALLNIRYGRSAPLTAGLIINAISILSLYTHPSDISYVITFFLFNTMWYFCLPYFLGSAAMLDKSGKWAAAASSASLFGIALGPAGFGMVYDAYGLSGIGWSGFTFSLVSLAIMLLVINISYRRNSNRT